MNAILKTIGLIVLADIMIAIPILLPISFIYNWYGFVILFLFIATFFVWWFIALLIVNYANNSQ